MFNISVIIPAFNAEKYIEETIESVLNQTSKVDEIIVIDDCSTDKTPQIILKYKNHPYFIIKTLKVNKGVSYCRNYAVELARNNWVLFLDADDLIHGTLVEKTTKYLTEYSKIEKLVLIHPAYQQIDSNGNKIGGVLRGKELFSSEGFGTLLVRNHIITPSGLTLNKDIFTESGGFIEEPGIFEDPELWLRLSLKGFFGYIDEPLTLYRRHGSNVTSDINKSTKSEELLLKKYDLQFIKKSILQRCGSHVGNVIDYVNILYRFKKYKEGYNELLKLESRNNDNQYISILFLKAIYYLQTEQKELAKDTFITILTINQNHSPSINNLGVILAQDLQFVDAEILFKKALSNHNGYMDAEQNLYILNKKVEEPFKFTLRELRSNLLFYQIPETLD